MANKTISIGFKIDDNGQGLKTLSMDATALRKAMQGCVKEADTFRGGLTRIGLEGLGFDAIRSGFESISSICQSLVDTYRVQEESETKLTTVMRERMGANEAMVQSIKDLCSAQQQIGVIGDEIQLSGAQQMATFLSTDSALKTLIPSMNNLIAQQKGLNATQSDAVSVANLMGKAMQGQVTALRRVGITFSDAQAEALKYGTEEERAALLAEIITQNVGDMNTELAKTSSGRMKQLSNAIGDAKEQLGKFASSIMPTLTLLNQLVLAGTSIGKIITGIRGAMQSLKNMCASAKQATIEIRGVGGAYTFSGKCATAFGIASRAAFAMVKAALISTGIGAAIWAIGEALGWIVGKLNNVSSASKDAASSMSAIETAAKSEEEALRQQQATFSLYIAKAKDFKGTKEEERKLCEELNSTYGDTLGYYSSISQWYQVLSQNSEKYARRLILEAKARRLANEAETYESQVPNLEAQLNKWEEEDKKLIDKGYVLPNYESTSTKLSRTMVEGARKMAQDARDKLEETVQEMNELSFVKGKGGFQKRVGVTVNEEKILPKGSIAAMEKQVSSLETKIKLTLDPDEIVKLEKEKANLKERIGEMKMTVRLILKKDDIEKIELDPIKVKIEADSLPKDLMEMPEGFEKSSLKVRNLQKDVQGISSAASSAGQAFQSLGQSFEMPALNIMGMIAQAIAQMVSGYASASAQSASLGPWAWAAFSLSGLAQLTGMIAQVKSIAKFANGGIVSGPMMAMVGEYAGASNNPEVIAPLNKLRSLIGTPQGAQTVVVGGDIRLRGQDIMIALKNQKSISGASGKRGI